jgi:hypothetical protein
MCTVTLVPLQNNDFVLISNRDEAPSRISIAPEFYNYKNAQLLYPKDVDSGGTWIGLSDQKRLICLLNGGFEIHEIQEKYRQSRGLVVKDFLSCNDLIKVIQKYNLMDIEPFTMILIDWNKELKFYELVWDSEQRHFQALKNEPHIWSSSTLYNEDMRKERQQWFQEFKENNKLNPDSLYNFHHTAGKGNADYGVIMDRGFVKTTSITRVEKKNDAVEMSYEDMSTKNHVVKFLYQAIVD